MPACSHGAVSPCGISYSPPKTRKDAKFSEPEINNFLASREEALVFQSRIMAEVHQPTELAAGCTEIIQDLRAVLIAQLRDRLDFENYFFVANEIRVECLNQCAAAIYATSAVVSTKMEFVEIPVRSPGTHDKPARETRSPYLDKRQNRPR